MAKVNRDRLLIIQIETKEAIENLESILAIPEVDVLYIGPNDLSISLGIGGQKESPILHAAIEKVLEGCIKYGKIPGIHRYAQIFSSEFYLETSFSSTTLVAFTSTPSQYLFIILTSEIFIA